MDVTSLELMWLAWSVLIRNGRLYFSSCIFRCVL